MNTMHRSQLDEVSCCSCIPNLEIRSPFVVREAEEGTVWEPPAAHLTKDPSGRMHGKLISSGFARVRVYMPTDATM